MYQAVMIMHGVGVFVYFIGFIVKNIISLVHYSNLETVCSIMLINGVLIVGLSIYFPGLKPGNVFCFTSLN